MARRSPPRKVTYFEPVPPRLARNTIIESTFEVGRRFRCTMRVDCGELDPGAVIRPVPGEWQPRMDKAAGLALAGEKPSPPKALSLTDPTAALTSKGKSKIAFAYGDNYLIDTKAAIIVDVEASRALDGGSGGNPHHDRPHGEPLRPHAQATGGGHGLRLRRQSCLVDGAWDRAAYPGDRPNESNRGHVHASQLHL
jgi:hypothetical protein